MRAAWNSNGGAPSREIVEWPEKWIFYEATEILLYVDVSIPTTWPQREATMKRHKAEITAAGAPSAGEIGFPLPPGATYNKADTLFLVSHYLHQLQGKTYAYDACGPRKLYASYYRGFSTQAMAAKRKITIQENYPRKNANCPAGEWPLRVLVYVAQDAPQPAALKPTDWPHDFLDVYRRANTSPPTAAHLGVPVMPGAKLLPLATTELAMERGVDNTARTGFAAVYITCDIAENASDDFYQQAFQTFGVARVNTWEDYDRDRRCPSTGASQEAWTGYAILASSSAAAR